MNTNNNTNTIKPFIISIEGIVGAGKTTFTEYLSKRIDGMICAEPVASWRESGILKKFLEDKERWGFTFQITVIKDRIQNLINCIQRLTDQYEKIDKQNQTANKGRIYQPFILIDRSIYSDKCFVEVLKENGFISNMEYDIYNDIWNKLESTIGYDTNPDMFIYIRPTIEACMDRIKQRGREEELTMETNYQAQLQTYHDNLLKNSDPRVIIIDNTHKEQDIRYNVDYCNTIVNCIKKTKENAYR